MEHWTTIHQNDTKERQKGDKTNNRNAF
jgi:hypothetical protein